MGALPRDPLLPDSATAPVLTLYTGEPTVTGLIASPLDLPIILPLPIIEPAVEFVPSAPINPQTAVYFKRQIAATRAVVEQTYGLEILSIRGESLIDEFNRLEMIEQALGMACPTDGGLSAIAAMSELQLRSFLHDCYKKL